MIIQPSNTQKGNAFRDAARPILERNLKVTLGSEVAIPIGRPPKNHRFDLVALDRSCVVQCKALAWRPDGGVPQAKITSVTEAVMTLRFLELPFRRMIAMQRAVHPKRHESLAEYYLRLHAHLLEGIELAELDVNRSGIRWLRGVSDG